MKKIIYFILVATSLIFVTSCELFKDKPIDKITQENIWENPSLMDAYLLPIYRNMHDGYNTSIMTGFVKNLTRNYSVWYTDQLSIGYAGAYTSSTYGDLLKGNPTSWTTSSNKNIIKAYSYINSVNLIIEGQNKLVNPNKERILGEVYFFRAWYYYRMFRDCGGVMLIDRVLNPLKDKEKFPRASFDEMIKFIVDDAEFAADRLEETYNSENIGRIRKGAALMLIAKTYYWASSPRFQNAAKPYLGFTNDRSKEMLEKCAAAYRELFKLKDHDLIQITGTSRDQIVKEYRKIFLMKHSKEGIFEFNHNNEGKGDGNLAFNNIDVAAGTPVDKTTKCAFIPTQNHVDEYRMNNAKRITDIGSTYDKQNPYVNRDVRFYANVLYDGATFRKRTIDIRSRWADKDGKFIAGKDMTASSKSNGFSNTGYYMAKLLDENFTFESNTYSKQNCIIWRLAEAYLDYAHVQFLLNETGDALEYVNKIRNRVKELPLTSVTLEDIMNERKVELAFEEVTYWDVMRGDPIKIMNGSTNPIYGVKIEERGGKVTYTYAVVNGEDNQTRYFDKRQLFLPLSWDDVRYHAVEQNPYWVE